MEIESISSGLRLLVLRIYRAGLRYVLLVAPAQRSV